MRRPAPRCRPTLSLALALLVLGPATITGADPPKIYKWVDANGIAHYTVDPDRIPKPLRNRIESVVRESAVPPDEAGSATDAAAAATDTAPAATDAASTARLGASQEPTAALPPSEPAAAARSHEIPAPTPAGPLPGRPVAAPEPEVVTPEPEVVTPGPEVVTTRPAVVTPGPAAVPAGPEGGPPGPAGAAPGATSARPPLAPTPASGSPGRAMARDGADWFERDAVPEAPDAPLLVGGQASPEQLDALAAQQEALDARIAELQAEVRRDESFLKGLISDPDLDSDVPLFDRPEFLEVSRRLPQLQAQLQELRDERAQLGTP